MTNLFLTDKLSEKLSIRLPIGKWHFPCKKRKKKKKQTKEKL